jgi:hypothetical protein
MATRLIALELKMNLRLGRIRLHVGIWGNEISIVHLHLGRQAQRAFDGRESSGSAHDSKAQAGYSSPTSDAVPFPQI